jgi:hypothetical protein
MLKWRFLFLWFRFWHNDEFYARIVT